MFRSLSRRKFIGGVTTAGIGLYLGVPSAVYEKSGVLKDYGDEPLMNWSAWEKYRTTVIHPCLTIKKQDLEYANENIRRYAWAKDHASGVERRIQRYFPLITPLFIEKMIEETTPGDPLWTPCPACRDKGKPVHPHGLWSW